MKAELFVFFFQNKVTAEQKKSEEMGVTEDDVNEIKQDISSFRFELIDILRSNGMNCGKAGSKDANAGTVFAPKHIIDCTYQV